MGKIKSRQSQTLGQMAPGWSFTWVVPEVTSPLLRFENDQLDEIVVQLIIKLGLRVIFRLNHLEKLIMLAIDETAEK